MKNPRYNRQSFQHSLRLGIFIVTIEFYNNFDYSGKGDAKVYAKSL